MYILEEKNENSFLLKQDNVERVLIFESDILMWWF